jgi:hypothetical protein
MFDRRDTTVLFGFVTSYKKAELGLQFIITNANFVLYFQ